MAQAPLGGREDLAPPWRRILGAAAVIAWLLGCSSPAPVPEQIAAEMPAPRELSADERVRADAAAAAAIELLRAERWEEAFLSGRAALELDPASARAMAVRGVQLMREAQEESPPALARWRQAEGELLRARRLAPGDPDVAVWLARFYAAEGHFAAAASVLDGVLAEAPEDAPCLRLAANLRYEMGEERRAAALLRSLLALTPEDAQARYRLAQCEVTLAESESDDAERARRLEQAAATFAEYRRLAPSRVDGWLGEAHARFAALQAGALEEEARGRALAAVLDLYREAQERAPSQADPVFGEGVVLEARGDRAGAMATYRRALRLQRDHAASLLNLAALLAEAGEGQEARELAERALRAGVTPQEERALRRFMTATPPGADQPGQGRR
jgi:tetratricopeptide (TPR) repeat protein